MSNGRRGFTVAEKEGLAIFSNGKCSLCRAPLEESYEGDHIVPFSKNGTTTIANGQALCRTCNRKKGASIEEQEILPPASAPLTLPLLENRVVPGFNDRHSQINFMNAFIQKCVQGSGHEFLAEMGTGSGKTASGISAIRHLFDLHEIEASAGIPLQQRRGVQIAVVLVTSTAVRKEWHDEIDKLLSLDPSANLSYRDPLGTEWVRAAGIVTPVTPRQIIIASPQSLGEEASRHALAKIIHSYHGEVIVLADEVHHFSEANHWGAVTAGTTQEARIFCGLSGTPYRHDDGKILGGPDLEQIKADFVYSKKEAIADRVVARVIFHTIDGDVSKYDASTGEILDNVRISSIENRAERMLSKAFGPESELLHSCLEAGVRLLEDERCRAAHGEALGGAITCADRGQLSYIKSWLEARGYNVLYTYCNDGQQLDDVISRFRRGEGDWILAIQRLSEGVNIPRLRVGVHINYKTLTRQFFEQVCGRLERLLPGIPPELQTGHIVIPHIPEFVGFAHEYEEQAKEGERLRSARTSTCDQCLNLIPKSVACCPYCETSLRKVAPLEISRYAAPAQIPPMDVEFMISAFHRQLIHRSLSIDPDKISELSDGFDARCRSLGVPGSEFFSQEYRAFMEYAYRIEHGQASNEISAPSRCA